MKDQRIVGVALILICIITVILATQGTTVEEKDVTAVLLLLPLGLYALFGKKRILYDLPLEKTRRK